jgi:hypothetical protein
MRPLLNYWPRFLQEVLEFNAIAEAEQPEFESAGLAVANAANEFFLETMSLSGVERWEKIMQITPNPVLENLEFRRKRIYNLYTAQYPFTRRWLEQKLNTIIGAGLWVLDIQPQNYKFYIQSAESNQNFANTLQETIENIKPANMEFFYVVWILVGIRVSPTFRSWLYTFLESGTEVCGTQYTAAMVGASILQELRQTSIINSYLATYDECGPGVCGTIPTDAAAGTIIYQPVQAAGTYQSLTTTFDQCGPGVTGTIPI